MSILNYSSKGSLLSRDHIQLHRTIIALYQLTMTVVQWIQLNDISFTESITLSNIGTRYSSDCVFVIFWKCLSSIMHHRLQIVLYAKNIQIIMTELFKIVSFTYKKEKDLHKCVEICRFGNFQLGECHYFNYINLEALVQKQVGLTQG